MKKPSTALRKLGTAIALGAVMTLPMAATAAPVITGTLDGATLTNALLGGGGVGIDLSTVNVTVSGNQIGSGEFSAGTYTNAAAAYGIAPGIIIGSGAVESFGTSNTTVYGTSATPAQLPLLQPISGNFSYNDVTQITINFDMLPGFESIFFNVTFQSVEFPVYVGSSFIDAFGLYVNGTNIAFVDSAPINIDHPFMGNDVVSGNGVLGSATAGVGNNAVGPLFHTFSSAVNPTNNTVIFIIADTGDSSLDSYAFISQLGGTPPPPPNGVPEPGTLALLGLGLAGLGILRRRRESH